jgi:hypothetical protein
METDYTKWSFKNKLWAALAACGSLAVLAYPPWFFRAQSFRAWIFESQVSGRLDAGRIGVEIVAVLVAAGLLAFVADLARLAFPGAARIRLSKYTAGLVMMASLIIAGLSFGYGLQMRDERNRASEAALTTERVLLGRLVKATDPSMDEYTKRTDLDLGSDVLQKYPYAITSLPSVPPFYELDRPKGDIFDRVAAQSKSEKPPDIQSVLDPLKVPLSVKADAFDAYYGSANPDAFKAAFDKLNIPQETKAALWDMKFGGGRFVPPRPEDMLSSPAPKTPNPAASMPKNQHR